MSCGCTYQYEAAFFLNNLGWNMRIVQERDGKKECQHIT